MKKYFFILLIAISANVIGQNFASIGTEWHYSEHASGACSGNCEYLHLESIADTIIQGKTTRKITQTYYQINGDTAMLNPIYVYEELDTVFSYSFNKNRFLTLYIFNKTQGDTITLDSPEDNFAWTDSTYRLVIDTVINTTINGVSLKKYKTSPLDDYQFYNGGYFIDKIGGLDWFFPRAATIPEAGGPIRCFSDTQIDTSFQTIACDHIIYTSIVEFTDNLDIEIYPNPTHDIFKIKSEKSINKVELYDLSGKLVLKTKKIDLNISELRNGQYIVKIYLSNGQEIERKIIKNTHK